MGRYIVRGTALLVVLTVFALPLLATAGEPAAGAADRFSWLWSSAFCRCAGSPLSKHSGKHCMPVAGRRADNVAIEWRWAEGALDRFATLVAGVIGLQVEVIVVPNATTADIAKQGHQYDPHYCGDRWQLG